MLPKDWGSNKTLTPLLAPTYSGILGHSRYPPRSLISCNKILIVNLVICWTPGCPYLILTLMCLVGEQRCQSFVLLLFWQYWDRQVCPHPHCVVLLFLLSQNFLFRLQSIGLQLIMFDSLCFIHTLLSRGRGKTMLLHAYTLSFFFYLPSRHRKVKLTVLP